jgi:hypothetical protein
MVLPTGILRPTTQPEPEPEGQGAEDPVDEAPEPVAGKVKAPKKARGKATAAAEEVEGLKLYLSKDVRFRLRMLAFQRGKKISTVANEVLDRNLPRWNLERTE